MRNEGAMVAALSAYCQTLMRQAAGSKPVYFPSPWSQASAGRASTGAGFVQRLPRTP